MQEQLRSHDQLDLLLEMEQPLAFVLAKMEIAGIKVERETLQGMQAENEKTLESLTKRFMTWLVRSSISTHRKQLGSILFEGYGAAAGVYKRPRQATRQQLMCWSV